MEWLLMLGAVGMSSILAPTILGRECLTLTQHAIHWDDLLRWLIVAITLSALISGVVMRLAIVARSAGLLSAGLLFGLACVGGFVFVVGTAGLYELLNGDFNAAGTEMFIGATFGAAVSVPCGMLFGLLFLGIFVPAQKHLANPAQDSIAHVARALSRVLLIASALAMLAVMTIEGPYCRAFFDIFTDVFHYQAPEGTDIAWTRFLIGVPLLLPALSLSAYAYVQARRFRLLREALGRRNSTLWSISDITPSPDALPLTDADRSAPQKRLLEGALSESADAYRHQAKGDAVYVGIIGAPELPR